MDMGQFISVTATLGGMLVMAGAFVWAIKANTMVLQERIGAQNERIGEMVKDLKKLNEVVTALALQDQRATNLEQRINTIMRRIDLLDDRYEELRHGEGFVYPLPIKGSGSS